MGDFDADDKDDILWRRDDRRVCIWLMDGLTRKARRSPGTAHTFWTIRGVGDFDAN